MTADPPSFFYQLEPFIFRTPNHKTTFAKKLSYIYLIISECLNYQYLNDPSRARGYESQQCNMWQFLGNQMVQTQWFSGEWDAYFLCDKNRCGTHAPGWLSGAHPTVAQGIKSVKVCFHWNDNCCMWSTNIRVRNCDGYYVYEFKKPPVCRLRYCGNSG